jgi:type IV secretory pathway VirB10-like protein
MSTKPIRKLNKRAIYWCLIGLVSLSVPAIVSLASSKEKSSQTEQKKHNPQANLNSKDGAIISGMEHFPENYAGVKEFEAELALAKPDAAKLEEALAGMESKNNLRRTEQGSGGHYYGGGRDDPWREASMREQKQRANDHYDSKRSDIMFIDNRRNNNKQSNEGADEDPTLKMLERTLAMAEKSIGQPNSDANEMFFMKKGEENEKGDVARGFLGKGKGAGGLKDPVPFMISEGTLIHAILLSEISTDLPGPILARVSHNIWDSQTGKALLIPQNSKLIGEYNSTVGHGQSRAQIVWTRIVYPNQQSVDLARMVGVDAKGTSGSAGTVDNHYDKVAIGLFMSTALGAGVRMTQGKYDPNTASMSQELGNSLAQETGRLGNKIADKMLDIKPTITVPMGEKLNVFVEADLKLRPYDG